MEIIMHRSEIPEDLRKFFEPIPEECAMPVLDIPTESYTGQHYATFPTALVRRCILVSTPAYGVCSHCAGPYLRLLDREKGDVPSYNGSSFTRGKTHTAQAARAPVGHGERTVAVRTRGWVRGCHCEGSLPYPAVVFDPFCGSGTTLLVARELQRHGIGMDLSWRYLHTDARQRLGLTALARWEGTAQATPSVTYDDLPLFGGEDALSLMR